MRTIAVMNNKGGVGKTTTVINLARILANRGHRVVMVDCDGQANLTRFFLPDKSPEEMTTLSAYLCGLAGDTLELEEIDERIRLLPASDDLYTIDVQCIKEGPNPFELRALHDLRVALEEDEDADFLLLDCPPGFTAASVAALMAAGEVVIPMMMDGFAFDGVWQLQRQIQNLRFAHYGLRISGVLITQWHNAEVVTKAEELLRQNKSIPVFGTRIRRTDKVPESTFQRTPLPEYSKTSSAAKDYEAFVDELLGGVANG